MATKKAPSPAVSPQTSDEIAEDTKLLSTLAAEYERAPTEPISLLIRRAQLVRASAKTYEHDLLARSQVTAAQLAELPGRIARLSRMEEAWMLARTERKSVAVKAAREPLELLKEDAIAALDYFCSGDEAVMAALDLIRPGDSHEDLCDDAKKIAALLEQNAAKLAKADFAGATPLAAAKGLRDGAQTLEEALDDRHVKSVASDAVALRNRAAAHLSELVDLIVAAGRYAFRRDPEIAAKFVGRNAGRPRRAAKNTPK